MDIVLMLLTIVGLAHALQSVDGPFGLFSKMRNLLARVPFFGHMLIDALSCDFCMGLWSGLGVYLFVNMGSWSMVQMLMWAFGGGAFNYHFNKLTAKLER